MLSKLIAGAFFLKLWEVIGFINVVRSKLLCKFLAEPCHSLFVCIYIYICIFITTLRITIIKERDLEI